jgi:CheY-like chemotaxis protein
MQGAAYDVVLMDVQMPRMDGMEATRLIRGAPDSGDPPTIIGMSADTSPQCQDQCRRAGMDAHLGKPVRIGELGAALELRIHRPGTFAVLDGDGHGPPATPEPAAAVYDADVFESLLADLGGDETMRREIADSFLFDVHERLTAIATAGDAGDLGALAFQAHAIKSASATLGLRALSEAANSIEAMASADGVDVGEQAARLVLECGRATDALSAAGYGTTGPR